MGIERRFVRRAIPLLALGALLAVAVWLALDRGTWQWLIEHEVLVRGWLTEEHPFGGFLLVFALFTLLSFVPGLAGKTMVVGWLMGFWPGLVIANVGLTLAAVGEFWLTRRFVREAVESRFGFYLRRTNSALERDGAFYLFAMRLAHVPYTLTNYVMGATRMSAAGFWWSTQLGMLPGNILFCYAGAQLPTLQDLSEHGVTSILTPQLVLAFVLLGTVPILLRWILRRVAPPAQRG